MTVNPSENVTHVQEIKSIGVVLEALKGKSEEGFEDTNMTKDIFQKIQVMELFILLFVLVGSALCFIAVSQQF